jgi:hypothetical protein
MKSRDLCAVLLASIMVKGQVTYKLLLQFMPMHAIRGKHRMIIKAINKQD